LRTFFCCFSCMGTQYIDQVGESPEKCRTWEKTPKSCHSEALNTISVT
jgi:hypothetical protein